MTDKIKREILRGGPVLLSKAAIILLMCILVWLTVLSMTTLAKLGLDGPFEDSIEFLAENVFVNLLLTAAATGAMLAVKALLDRGWADLRDGLWLRGGFRRALCAGRL